MSTSGIELPGYFTTQEAAKLLGKHEKTIRRRIAAGKIRTYFVAGVIHLIPLDEMARIAHDLKR